MHDGLALLSTAAVAKLDNKDDGRLQTIRALLAQPIQREAEVVYFLVELRKLIERMENRFIVLNFFCDWVLHDKLSWKNAKDILAIFDDYVKAVMTERGKAIVQATKRLEPLISFQRFSDDLSLLLNEYHLDAQLVCSLNHLLPFLSLYVDIVSKVPLIASDPKFKLLYINNIRISKVTTRIDAPGGPRGRFAFGVNWSLRKEETEVASIVNEIWIPAVPIRAEQLIARLTKEDGKLKRVPLESTKFVD